MKKRFRAAISLLISAGVLLTGCGNAIPELTEEQQELVVEYAAGTLLKYDKNHENRLIDIEELEIIEAKTEEMHKASMQTNEMQTDVNQSEVEENVAADDAEADVTVLDNTQSEAITYVSIEDFLQLEQLAFDYKGFEIVDEYPNQEQEQELFFVMNATMGKKLLVLKFQVDNTSGSDVELNMNQCGVRFKIVVDGEEKNALTTMLLNDMAYYQGTIAAGTSQKLVLVCEVSTEKAQGLSTLELIMKNVENTATISLN